MTDLHSDYARSTRGALHLSLATRDQVLLTLWLLATVKQFPGDELILYPLAAYYGYAFLRNFDVLLPLLLRSWVLFAFPVWWALSVLWGFNPGLIVKSTAQLFLTIMICYCVVQRLHPRQVLQSVLLAGGVYGVASLVLEPTGGIAARGVFSSKNQMGLTMVLLWSTALCVLFDRHQPKSIRLCALVLGAVAFKLVLQSQSATAVLLALGVTLIVVFGLLVQGRGLLHPAVTLTVSCSSAFVTLALGLFLATNDVDIVALVLNEFGKDATLTGRTVLWQYAFDEIRQRPLLGVGDGGFWNPRDWTSVSRRIYIDFHKPYGARFSFHNSYLEIAVHQGLIGLFLGVTAFLWAVAKTFGIAVKHTTMPRVFFLVVAVLMLMRNMTEPGLLRPFSLYTMLVFIGALFAVRDSLARPKPRLAVAMPAGSPG